MKKENEKNALPHRPRENSGHPVYVPSSVQALASWAKVSKSEVKCSKGFGDRKETERREEARKMISNLELLRC